MQRHGVAREVFGGLSGRGGAVGCIEVPDDGLAAVLHLHSEIGVGGTLNDIVVALGPVTVEAEACDVHGDGVTGHGSVDKEGAGLGIATHDAGLVIVVYATGIDRGGVD